MKKKTRIKLTQNGRQTFCTQKATKGSGYSLVVLVVVCSRVLTRSEGFLFSVLFYMKVYIFFYEIVIHIAKVEGNICNIFFEMKFLYYSNLRADNCEQKNVPQKYFERNVR